MCLLLGGNMGFICFRLSVLRDSLVEDNNGVVGIHGSHGNILLYR